jgi:ubiquinone/menaquinone biosynthesis C-methylase UbiE
MKNDTYYDLNQLLQNEKGWLFYEAAFKCWKEINENIIGESVLDVGSGSGISLALTKVFRPLIKAVGIEGDKDSIALSNQRNVETKVMSIFDIKYDSNSFDTVYTSHVLEHLEQPELVIDECYRVAKKRVIHVVPDGDVDKNNFGTPHIHIFNRKNFRELFAKYENSISRYYSIYDSHMNSLIIIIEK